ncbi:hypothetical protein CEE37_09430 [candidate division LCP-89 bacterium B3_LCP]|uniref:Methyltransferase type 11 domain-containing protein n=1 Tax=candidate division LCP-89 bacterium B3_LCP TaxID=2012998 RepID=A0A532UYC0_UNCL8|nr:MAG: hypothetical protein CEE37_09430 [candidate division LCP-89 bacterium B3_LCP]
MIVSTRHQVILEKEKRWKRRLYRLIPSYRFSNDIYEDAIKERLGESVRWVDLGCGRNELIDELSDSGATAVGLDRQTHPQLLRTPLRFVIGDVNNLPFADKSLDLLSANDVFEHLSSPISALAEMRRVLKPDGRVIVRTPNVLHPLILIGRLIPEKLKKRLIYWVFGVLSEDVFPTYYRANSYGRLMQLCKEAGFHDIKIQTVEDVHTAYGAFFFLSLFYYHLVNFKPLRYLRTCFVMVAKR